MVYSEKMVVAVGFAPGEAAFLLFSGMKKELPGGNSHCTIGI
jgi:hypothetical protein